MLPEIILDNEEYQEIFEEARSKIASIYPEWTDYNYHDPGITMLELFSWLKEGQQFYLNQTGEGQKDKFLKLLGTRRQVKEPAHAMLTMDTEENVCIPKGTKFFADTLCYESVDKNYILKEEFTKCFYARERIIEYVDRRQLHFGHRLKIYMFGNAPAEGDCFYIGLLEALPKDEKIDIWFDIFDEYERLRKPIVGQRDSFLPFVEFKVEYFTSNGWVEVDKLQDETYGFLQDGQLSFVLQEQMEEGDVHGQFGYFIRIRLIDGVYDVPPILTGFGMNILKVRQTDHIVEHCRIAKCNIKDKLENSIEVIADTFLSIYGDNDLYIESDKKLYEIDVVQKYIASDQNACFFHFTLPEEIEKIDAVHLVNFQSEGRKVRNLDIGNGYPNQSYCLYDEWMEYESFELMVEQDEGQGNFVLWERVFDFANSSPEDRHYTIDTRQGIVSFGDSIHGLAPEGEIRILQYVRTHGSDGKVKANQLNQISKELTAKVSVYNKKNSEGGKREETYEESFIRVQRELKHPLTAVTYQDYEEYIRNTPGLMIENCKALTPSQVKEIFPYYDESSITVVVKPYTKQLRKELMYRYQENILTHLEPYRMIGTSVNLIRPEYIRFTLHIEVMLKAHYIHGKEEVEEAVNAYFQELGRNFGGCVIYSKLYGVIDMLPCVRQMQSLSIDVIGTGVKHLADGSIQVPPNGVVELEDVAYQFTIG